MSVRMEGKKQPVLILIYSRVLETEMFRSIAEGGEKYNRYDFSLLAEEDFTTFSFNSLYDEVACRIKESPLPLLVIPLEDRSALVHAALALEFPHIKAPSVLSQLVTFHKGLTNSVCPSQYTIPTLPLPIEANISKEDWIGAGLKFPLFIKPAMGTASVLTKKVDNDKELKGFLAQGKSLVKKLSTGLEEFVSRFMADSVLQTPTRNVWILQHYIECTGKGKQCCIDGLVVNGNVTLWDILELEFWEKAPTVIKCESSPPELEAIQEQNLVQAFELIVAELVSRGFDNQFVDVEAFVMNNGKVHLIEVNARAARTNFKSYRTVNKNGDGLWALLSIAEGVSPEKPVRDPHIYACIAYVVVFGRGLAKDFMDIEKAKKEEQWDCRVDKDAAISPKGEWGHNLGYCYGFGRSRKEATEKVRAVVAGVVTAKETCLWLTH